MKKAIRLFILMITIVIICGSSGSCVSKTGLEVKSSDFNLTRMQPKAFNKDEAYDWFTPDNSYLDYYCFVSVEDGKLCVNCHESAYPSVFHMEFDCGYFVGVDLGEWDSWIYYYPYHSNMIDEDPSVSPPVLVSTESCKGFIKIDNRHGYLLTGPQHIDILTAPVSEEGTLHELRYSEEMEKWTWKEQLSFTGSPLAFFYSEDDSMLYIATTKNILAVKNFDQVEILVESDIIGSIGVNSLVCLEGVFYCGSAMGVYSFDPEKNTETWYPANYEEMLSD